MNRHIIGRSTELEELQQFIDTPMAGVLFLRGRRRVGKSTLLMALKDKNPNIFYFSGILDQNSQKTLLDYANFWDQFSKQSYLSNLRHLSWKIIFVHITNYLKELSRKKRNLVLIFDEIQWIAKTKTGCIGAIKEAYLDWESLGVKIILCGSSNKFFEKNSNGDETILRGMRTRRDMWIQPFSLKFLKENYFPNWKDEEIAMTYMFLGGIPYYLNRITNPEVGFIHSINKAIFSKETIFLDEVDEVLRLEFNERGLKTVKKILSSLGEKGKTQSEIVLKTGISKSTISQMIDSLCEYNILFTKKLAHKENQNEAGLVYYLKDFYLRFYFQVLILYKEKISQNNKGLLFPEIFHGNYNQYYIPSYSGVAFEMLVKSILNNKGNLTIHLFKILNIVDCDYEVLDYWNKETQIDIIVEHQKDRIARILECKWIGADNNSLAQYIREVKIKKYTPPKSFSLKYFLVISKNISKEQKEKAKKEGVEIITLLDLYS